MDELEIWKSIPEYDGYYEVSNMGNIKSLERYTNNGRYIKEKIIRVFKREGKQSSVRLSKDGIKKTSSIAYLIGTAFIGLPTKKNMVYAHKNKIIDDDRIENIELIEKSTSHKKNYLYGKQINFGIEEVGRARGLKLKKTNDKIDKFGNVIGRICTCCKKEKLINEYGSKGNRTNWWCKDCTNLKNSKYRNYKLLK